MLQTLPVTLARSTTPSQLTEDCSSPPAHHLVTSKLHLCCRRSRRNTFSNGSETCWASFKTRSSAQQSSPLRWADHLTPIHSGVSLFWCFTFTWSFETLNCLKRDKFTDFSFIFSLSFCVPWTGLYEATAFHVGGRSGTDGRGDDPPHGRREQRRNCHSKSQRVDVCECRFVCRRTMGGCVMALRVLRQTGSAWYEWLTLLQHLFRGKLSLSF